MQWAETSPPSRGMAISGKKSPTVLNHLTPCLRWRGLKDDLVLGDPDAPRFVLWNGKLRPVKCPRDTRFWLYDDGSYEEEGQNNIRGCIWRKVKFLYTNKFTAGELLNMKLIIQSNVYRYICILLEGREKFEEEAMNKESSGLVADRSASGESENDMSRECMYSVNQKIKQFSDWLLDIMAAGDIDTYFPTSAREYASFIDKIWKDPAIQETYKRREDFKLLSAMWNISSCFLPCHLTSMHHCPMWNISSCFLPCHLTFVLLIYQVDSSLRLPLKSLG